MQLKGLYNDLTIIHYSQVMSRQIREPFSIFLLTFNSSNFLPSHIHSCLLTVNHCDEITAIDDGSKEYMPDLTNLNFI
jgi:hypothetical protein